MQSRALLYSFSCPFYSGINAYGTIQHSLCRNTFIERMPIVGQFTHHSICLRCAVWCRILAYRHSNRQAYGRICDFHMLSWMGVVWSSLVNFLLWIWRFSNCRSCKTFRSWFLWTICSVKFVFVSVNSGNVHIVRISWKSDIQAAWWSKQTKYDYVKHDTRYQSLNVKLNWNMSAFLFSRWRMCCHCCVSTDGSMLKLYLPKRWTDLQVEISHIWLLTSWENIIRIDNFIQ